MARVADQLERYEDAISFLKETIEYNVDDHDERNLLFELYYEITEPIRKAINCLNEFLEDDSIGCQCYEKLLILKEKCLYQLQQYCQDILNIIDRKYLTQHLSDEDKVFFLRKKADYLRYLNENMPKSEKILSSQQISDLYNESLSIAKKIYICNDPEYLRVSLSYSVFLYEFIGNKYEGLSFIEDVFRKAINLYDEGCIDNDPYESPFILKSMQENIDIWSFE